ncbi:MAG TPA: hypothetical protein VFE16_09970 [Candidatus Cybelea sp.]|jgi:hypothetical protein|nr:hypothetical protein [Candidatus Cybelea sp.]
MSPSTPTRAVPAFLLIALLGGCGAASSGGSQPLLTLPAELASSAHASQRPSGFRLGVWVFTAQLYGEDLKIYHRNGLALTYFETLTSGVASPSGTVTAPDGRWYVANGGHSNVLVYRTTTYGPQGPTQVLDDYGQRPVNVGLTPNRDLVAVSNGATTSGGAGSVSIYLNRNAEPARMLTYGKDILAGMGVAIDHLGNCYWSFNDPKTHSGSIVEFTACAGKGTVVVSAIPMVGGLALDRDDNLYYVDQVTGIYRCDRATKCVLFSTGYGTPANVNFDRDYKHLWVADESGYIDAVSPQNGAIVYKVKAAAGSSDPPFGIAPAPGS